jgi:preprotein translocase subunit SecF
MIELFKQPNIDWMGKAKYFYALSGILLLAGWVSILFGSGIRYGIDFKGGTNVDVRFAQPPNLDKLRSGLTAQGLGNTEIQTISEITNPNSNEVEIFVEGKGQDEQTLDANRAKVLSALNATYGVSNSGKADFNSATPTSLAALLNEKDPFFSPPTPVIATSSSPKNFSTTATRTPTASSPISTTSPKSTASPRQSSPR